MRILSIQPAMRGFPLSPSAGGKDIAAHAVVEAFLEDHHEVGVMAMPWGLAEQKEKSMQATDCLLPGHPKAVTLLPTGSLSLNPGLLWRHLPRRKLLKSPALAIRESLEGSIFDLRKNLLNAVRAFQPDLIINHQTGSPAPLYLRESGIRIPLVLVNHSSEVSPHLTLYDHVVWVSKWHRLESLAKYPEMKERCSFVPYFVNKTFTRSCQLKGGTDICFVGLLYDDRKGLDILLEAMESGGLKNRLHVIGDGARRSYYEEQAAARGVDAVFHGTLGGDDIWEIMQNCLLLCVPSRAESFGIVYIEALCSGLPVIGYAPTVRQLQDEFSEEVGLPFDPAVEKPESLAVKMAYLASHSHENLTTRISIALQCQKMYCRETFKKAYQEIIKKRIGL